MSVVINGHLQKLNAQQPRSNSNSGTNSVAGDGDSENPVVEEESDRAREEAAQREARRIVPSLTRGPYLQLGTPNSMVVRWRTEQASPSIVRFGLSSTNLK